MSKLMLLLVLPVIGWLIYKSKEWEEGEWIKRHCKIAFNASLVGIKAATRYLVTDADMLPRSMKRNQDGKIVRIERSRKS